MNLNIWRSKGIGGEWFLCLLLKISRHTYPRPKGERALLKWGLICVSYKPTSKYTKKCLQVLSLIKWNFQLIISLIKWNFTINNFLNKENFLKKISWFPNKYPPNVIREKTKMHFALQNNPPLVKPPCFAKTFSWVVGQLGLNSFAISAQALPTWFHNPQPWGLFVLY